MEELFKNVANAVISTAVFAVFFWGLSVLLRKPEGRTEGLKNFHSAHPPSLINKEFKCEAFYPFVNIFISQPLLIVLIFALVQMGAKELPYQIFGTFIGGLPVAVQIVLGLLILDISLWIRHSFVHKFFWSFHAVHHSARELTWLTTHRLHPLDQVVMSLINMVILYIVGFSAEGMAAALIIKDLNNMFVHSNIVLDYPKPLKYILVSPNMHRWHHATEIEARDKNFCVVFAFVDYLLGTYYVPDNALPAAYGTDNPEMDDIEHKTIWKELWLPFRPAQSSAAKDNIKDDTAGVSVQPGAPQLAPGHS